MIKKGVGVENLTLSYTSNIPTPCALCQEKFTGKGYMFLIDDKEEASVLTLDEMCFFQLVFVIRTFIDKNGVQYPKIMEPQKRIM